MWIQRVPATFLFLTMVSASFAACGGHRSLTPEPNSEGGNFGGERRLVGSARAFATKVPAPPVTIPNLSELRAGAAHYGIFIRPVVSATPTGTPIPYLIVSQGTVGGIYTGGASCAQPDCGPDATWSKGSVPAGTDLTFTPNPAPINNVIPIALLATTSGATPAVDTVTASWVDGKYSATWSQIWDIVLPFIYRVKINPSAPSPSATPTMLFGLGPYSSASTIQGNLYTDIEGSYFASTPDPNTVHNLDPTPMPTATQQERADFVFDGQTPQPFGLSFKKTTLMPGRTYDVNLTWQTAYFDGANWIYSGAVATASAKLPCDNLSNEVANYYLGDKTPVDNLAVSLSNDPRINNTLPAIIYSPGSNPNDNAAITILKPTQGSGPGIEVSFITKKTYNLTYNYTSADTTPAEVASHLNAAIAADPTASQLVKANVGKATVTMMPAAPYYPGFPTIQVTALNGANLAARAHYTSALSWALGNQYPQDGIIWWWQKTITQHNLDGQEVLFHELDHHYYEGLKVLKPGPTFTSTISFPSPPTPVTFSWNTSDPSGLTYHDFEHLLIHNDFVHAYGSDMTGALAEAFASGNVSPTPTQGQLSTIYSNYSNNRVPVNEATPAPAVITGQTCSMVLRAVNAHIDHDDFNIIRDVAY